MNSNIGLSVIDFLIEPKYEKIKDIIPELEKLYIEEYGECYQEQIHNNFSKCNYVFLANFSDTMKSTLFLQNFLVLHLYWEIHNRLANFNSPLILEVKELIQVKINKTKENILEKQFSFSKEVDDIKYYLEYYMNQEIAESNDKMILSSQIKFLEQDLEQYKKLEQKIETKHNFLINLQKNKENLKGRLQRKFISNHMYLLSEQERDDFLNETKSIDELIQDSDHLHLYFNTFFEEDIFNVGRLGCFKPEYDESSIYRTFRSKCLREAGIQVQKEELQDGEKCLSKFQFKIQDEDGVFYSGVEALNRFEELIENYNTEYKSFTSDLDIYLMPKEKFNEKYIISDEILDRTANSEIKSLLNQYHRKLNYNIWSKNIFNQIENCGSSIDGIYMATDVTITNEQTVNMYHVILSPLMFHRLTGSSGQLFHNSYLFTLSHELGHVSTFGPSSISGFDFNSNYTILNELFNDYLGNKVLHKLLSRYSSDIYYYHHNSSFYHLNFFLIEPFVLEYEQVFKEASIKNSITPLLELMGEENFHEYNNLIQNFYNNQEKFKQHPDLFEEFDEYVSLVKEKIEIIFQKVQNNHKSKNTL